MVTSLCRNLIGQWFPACWSLIWRIACCGAHWVCRISYCNAKSCINIFTSAANLLSPINPTCRSLDCGPGDDPLSYRENKKSQRMNPAGVWTSNLLPVRGQWWQNDKFDPLNLTVVSTQLSSAHNFCSYTKTPTPPSQKSHLNLHISWSLEELTLFFWSMRSTIIWFILEFFRSSNDGCLSLIVPISTECLAQMCRFLWVTWCPKCMCQNTHRNKHFNSECIQED